MRLEDIRFEHVAKEFYFGLLYKAHHEQTSYFVFQFNRFAQSINKDSLSDSIASLRGVESANLVKPITVLVDEEGQKLYVVYEYCPGVTLDEYVSTCAHFTTARFMHIANVFAASLLQLHNKGIVHGNVQQGIRSSLTRQGLHSACVHSQ
jgi:serine/threonine protein kinase